MKKLNSQKTAKVPVEAETYDKLETRAKDEGLTVDDLTTEVLEKFLVQMGIMQ